MRIGWLLPALPSGAQLKALCCFNGEMDQKTLKQLVNYNPETGEFTWAQTRKNCPKGTAAGHLCKSLGYRQIRLNYKLYLAHRLAWIYCFGELGPREVIDHINGNRSDNRISNLRKGTHAQNMQNRKIAQSDSQTGVLGVFYDKRKNRFTATVKKNGVRVFQKRFKTLEEASAAYLEAKRRLHEFCSI